MNYQKQRTRLQRRLESDVFPVCRDVLAYRDIVTSHHEKLTTSTLFNKIRLFALDAFEAAEKEKVYARFYGDENAGARDEGAIADFLKRYPKQKSIEDYMLELPSGRALETYLQQSTNWDAVQMIMGSTLGVLEEFMKLGPNTPMIHHDLIISKLDQKLKPVCEQWVHKIEQQYGGAQSPEFSADGLYEQVKDLTMAALAAGYKERAFPSEDALREYIRHGYHTLAPTKLDGQLRYHLTALPEEEILRKVKLVLSEFIDIEPARGR